MKIIHEMNPIARKVLRLQKVSPNVTLRTIAFCLTADVPEGRLLFNTMTRELLLLEGDEIAAAKNLNTDSSVISYLTAHWFLVPEDHDDRKLSNELTEVARLLDMQKSKKGMKLYTILSTTDCNARCFYCFEHGGKKMTMDNAMSKMVSDYILRTCSDRPVFSWFGGEPLYNTDAIDSICTAVSAAGVDFRSKMISNGYLFDEDMVQKAASLWKLGTVQITLDGTEDIYNKRKAYIYRNIPSPFRRVLNNIELLLSAGIAVRIRLNMDMNNAEDLQLLCSQLYARFGQHEKFSVYPVLLYQDAMEKKIDSTPEKLTHLFSLHGDLQKWLRSRGILHQDPLDFSIKLNQCMADSAHSVVVQPDGALLPCEHYNECEPWGHAESIERNADILRAWREYIPPICDCDTCPLVPTCYRLRKCPLSSATCHPLGRANRVDKIRWAMEDAWNNFKSNQ